MLARWFASVLRPLAAHGPERLVRVWEQSFSIGRNGSYARQSTRRVALEERLLARLADAVRRDGEERAEGLDAREAHDNNV